MSHYSGRTTHSEIAYSTENPEKRVPKIVHNPFHAWAHMTQTFGCNSFGNVFFEGAKIYSYGHHWLAGYRIPGTSRHYGVALINASKNSVTTSKHMGYVRQAARDLTVYYIPSLDDLNHDLPADTEYKRANIVRHVAKHIEDFEHLAAAYMLELAGSKHGAKDYVKMLSKHEKDKRDTAKREAQRHLAQMVERAKKLQAYVTGKNLPPLVDKDVLANFERDCLAGLRRDGGSTSLTEQIRKIREAHKALPAKTHGKLKSFCWSVIKRFKALEARGIAEHEMLNRKRHLRDAIATFRKGIARYEKYKDSNDSDLRRDSHDLNSWLAASDYIRGWFSERAAHVKLYQSLTATSDAIRNAWQLAYDAEQAAALAKRQKADRERFEREAAKREAWLDGLPVRFYGTDENGKALLRVKQGRLETSQGAAVPLEDAIKVFRLVKLCKEAGRSWQRNGHTMPVGSYQVDSIYPNGDFKAGCHLISWGEVERVALAIGVYDQPAADTSVESEHA